MELERRGPVAAGASVLLGAAACCGTSCAFASACAAGGATSTEALDSHTLQVVDFLSLVISTYVAALVLAAEKMAC